MFLRALPLLLFLFASAPAMAGSDFHDADTSQDGALSLAEVLRVIQLYNGLAIQCDGGSEDGFAVGDALRNCAPHDSDYDAQDWSITLSELLRAVQLFNSDAYYACPAQSEDDFCPGMPPAAEGEGDGGGEAGLVPDENLRAALRDALELQPENELTAELIGTLTRLAAPHGGITDLTGLEFATSLTELELQGNCVASLAPLSGLIALEILNLHANAISDVSPIAGMTALRLLWLSANNIGDPSPLESNAGLGDATPPLYDRVALAGNPLDHPDAADAIAALESRGVGVWTGAIGGESSCNSALTADDPVPMDIRLIHGDPELNDANAYVMVYMGDAYAEEDLDNPMETVADVPGGGQSFSIRTYSRAIADSVSFALSQEPLAEYASYFKVYRIDLVSREGQLSDNRQEPPLVFDTALGMARETLSFSFDDPLLRRVADVSGVPYDRICLMPNSVGSGKNIDDITQFSNVKISRTMTALHELGHGIGGLTDEYEYQHGTNPPTPKEPATRAFANSISMTGIVPALEEIPWNHWIDAVCVEPDQWLGDNVDYECVDEDCQCAYGDDFEDCVPLPTCEPGGNFVDDDGKIYGRAAWPEPDEDTTVGLYEGSWFRTKGAYRPELRCRMRSDDDTEPQFEETPRFCKVCREELNLRIVDDTGNARSWSPANDAPLSLADAGLQIEFSIELHTPASEEHEIEVLAWLVDGVEQMDETDTTFTLTVADLQGAPPHAIEVITADRSAFVLPHYADGQMRLQRSIVWTLEP